MSREMKFFRSARIKSRQGFSLVEASLSVGVLGFGVLSLAPMLGVGLTSARQARDGSLSARIAENLTDEARAGTPLPATTYCDDEGVSCPAAGACYQIQATQTTLAGNCTRLAIQVTPLAARSRPLDYVAVLPPP
jgi:Tfp pilus assembly protein PilV